MDAATLLTIDAGRELARLARDRLQGPWQIPTELVRWAVRSGARGVAIRIGRRDALVEIEGAELPAGSVEDLELAVHSATPTDDRHDALGRVEARHLLAFLAAADHEGSVGACLEPGAGGVAVRLSRIRWDPGRAREWVERACRFAPVPVSLDGTALVPGFAETVAEAPMGPPLQGRVAITPHGAAPSIWLLVHGVLATRATLPGYPAFHAAVEMAPLCPWHDNGAALREALEPHAGALVRCAVDLLAAEATRLTGLPPGDAARVRHLLLDAARAGIAEGLVEPLEMLPDASGGSHSLASLRAALDAPGGRVHALPDGAGPGEHLLLGGPVLVLPESDRSLVAAILGTSLPAPPPSRFPSRLRFTLRRAALSFREALPGATVGGSGR